ncbi:MAG: hypothetical protein ACREA4_09990, partial [Nitrososphaera sp.]
PVSSGVRYNCSRMEEASIIELARALKEKAAATIGIDGYLGAGKTTVAKTLSRQTGYRCVHLDQYLDPRKGGFLDNLDLATLKMAIEERPLIIEGLCLLKVLAQLQANVDFLVFVVGLRPDRKELDKKVFDEADMYLQAYRPTQKADVIFNMDRYNSNQSNEIDIAYIKAKTAISIVLAVGGILSILVGALVFVLGLQGGDTALIKVAGVEISAKGVGGVTLGTSAVWAYLAYLARPKYSRKREVKESKKNDGSFERHEFESSTQIDARPEDNT